MRVFSVVAALGLLSAGLPPGAVEASAGRADGSRERVDAVSRSIEALLGGGDLAGQLGRLYDLSGTRADGPRVDAPSAQGAGAGQEELKARMLASLDFIRQMFKSGYAPAEWKKKYAGWDLDAEIEKAKQDILSKPAVSVKDFQSAARRVIDSTRDYHVSIWFNSTEKASLPFTVLGASGRYYIAWINRDKLPESSFPFSVGDELVDFGGRSAAEVAAELQAAGGKNTEETDRALAALRLTSRRAASGLEVPREPVLIGVRRKGSEQVVTQQLAWDYTPESVRFEPGAGGASGAKTGEEDGKRRFKARMNDMLSPLYVKPSGLAAGNPFGLGARRSFIPDLGEKIWESGAEEPFHAYIYRAEGGRVMGCVRIPSYTPEDVGKAVEHFGKLMAKLERTTDGLVIDQVNNPGGGVFYLYTLASMLSDKALRTPKHRIALTQNEVVEAADLLELAGKVSNDEDAKKYLGPDINGYPTSYVVFRHIIDYARFVVDEWNAGRTLTNPTHLYGVDQINPSTVARYTKPVLLLVNELDFSGGDFFPAIMQDNKRVTVFGTRTAGAGGYVLNTSFPNHLGINGIYLTGSIAERADGNPIENLGVKPDVEYALKDSDLQNGFEGYVKAINAAAAGTIEKSSATGR